MTSLHTSRKSIGYLAASAMAVAMLAGCAGSAHLAKAGTYGEREAARDQQGGERDVTGAERAVAKSPQNASLRTALGIAYLQAGRFTSATTALDDAMRLGDNSPRTALSLALAKIGAGHGREAVAILDDWRDSIPASDLGLALALAGESTRGVAILTDSLRGGQNTAKTRQNLSYAYALDGRWREARTMMMQDVPADEVDRRISDWAMQGKPEDTQKRVAGLLGAPMRSDPGLPKNLALGDATASEQLAAETTATPAQSNQTAVAASELPATDGTAIPVPVVPVAAEPAVAAPASVQVAAPAVPSAPSNGFMTAFSGAEAPAPATESSLQAPVKTPRTVRVALPAAKPVIARNGSHLVQLGSFSSPQGARRGWGILAASNPQLREYRMVITPAVVRGRNYWRVAAAGFDYGTAHGMCSTVKSRGGACFAYAANQAPAGALPGRILDSAGPQRARRR